MKQIKISDGTFQLLQKYFNTSHDNDAARKTLATEVLARISTDLEINLSVWNARPLRFKSFCGECGEEIQVGEKAWITTGQSPRCFEHGKP